MDDSGTSERPREPKVASLGGHAAFQRQFWGPNSRFSWAVADEDPPLVAREVRSCADFGVLPHAAVASPKVRKLPHKCTRRGQNPSISAPGLPHRPAFLHPNPLRDAYFCTGREMAKEREIVALGPPVAPTTRL
jgi:hypothetical protein